MTKSNSIVCGILEKLNEIDIWSININMVCSAITTGLRGQGYALFSLRDGGQTFEHSYRINKKWIDQSIKTWQDNHVFHISTTSAKYRLYIKRRKEPPITSRQHDGIQQLINLVSSTMDMRQISKDRIIETQIINQLNLNVTTALEEKKIVKNLESAARQMLGNDIIFLFYLVDDRLIGSNISIKIEELPQAIIDELFKVQQIFTTKTGSPFFQRLAPRAPVNAIKTIIPFAIKHELRGFFVVFDDIVRRSKTFAITRLKFLTNQAALALERIDLFRAVNRALKKSQGIQELVKIMLSSLDLSSLFSEILQRAQKLLGFRRILFSLYDSREECFKRVTGVGISKAKLREAMAICPPFNAINALLNNKYRISNSFYIPAHEVRTIRHHVREYELYPSAPRERRLTELWDPGDIFISPIFSKDRELVAILSLDLPMNNLVPTIEQVRLLETFGDFLGMAIENAQLFEKIENLSNTDEMTCAYNYRYLRERVASLIQRRVRPLSIAIIDLDSFKICNDQYGHLYGDQLLRKFSQLLMQTVGRRGEVIRYGGDEFIIILPGKTGSQSETLLKKILTITRKHKLVQDKLPIEFSYGIAVYPRNGRNLGDLIDCADKRLYKMKTKKNT